MSRYRITSEAICAALRQGGPMPRVPIPQEVQLVQAEAMNDGKLPLRIPDNSACAMATAATRIEALEREVAALRAWQEELAAWMQEKRPTGIAAEYPSAWKLLCEHAREKYHEIERHVNLAVLERQRAEHARILGE